MSFEIFKRCLQELENIVNNNNNDDNKNHNLCKLFAISYIKIYLNKLTYFIYEKNQFIGDTNIITKALIGNYGNNTFRKVLKIYVFKLFFNLMDRDWEKVGAFNFSHYGIQFTDILTENNEANNDIKEIINETINPNDEKYKEYPLLKYFIYTKYKTKEDFMNSLGPKEQYEKEFPLLFKYLEDKKDGNLKKLQNLPIFNEFTNYMIDYYSFNISREDAKDKELYSETIYREKGFDKKFLNFKKAWKGIKKKAIQYKYHPKMEEKTLEENDKLIYFLNDDSEVGYGMYLVAAYENFIKWQNEFLNYIIENGVNKSNLNLYIENMKNEIPIYEANSNQILLINNFFSSSIFYGFDDLINTFSYRNIFNEDGTTNYKNYNDFKYDISTIEEELAKLILSGKCLFEKDNIRLVIYWGEGFNRGKSDILEKFYKRYKQKDLEEKEKKIILKYMKGKININKNQFFASLQLLIFYLGNNNLNENDTINSIIENAPKYLRIEDHFSEFFREEGKELKANKIMGIFFFFEHLCYQELFNTIQNNYKKDIKEEIKEKISTKLLDNELNFQINIKDLGAALRRFISRYLVGKNQNAIINENAPLIPLLKRPELWEEKLAKLTNLEELISHQLEEFKLTVGQSFQLYEIIKNEDEKEIFDDEAEEEEEEEEDDNYKQKKGNPFI